MRISLCSIFLAVSFAASAVRGEVLTFNVDSSTLTHAHGINDSRRVVGFHQRADTGDARHGFVREPDGSFSIAGPGGFCPPLCSDVKAHSITNAGDIAGTYGPDSNHGFIRTAAGAVTTFDVPAAAGTFADGINASLQVSGYFDDAICPLAPAPCSHGFIRNADGTFLSFDAPASTGTFPGKINDAGDVAGSFNDLGGNARGFIRKADGSFLLFDVPGSVGTEAEAINNAGIVVGAYVTFDPSIGFRRRGFMRSALGAFTTVGVPGARATVPSGINDNGDIVGSYDLLTAGGRITRGFVITAAAANSDVPALSGWAVMTMLLSLIALALRRLL